MSDENEARPGGSQPSGPRKTILTVGELTSRIKSVLESSFPFVWVHGEISNFRIPASGHFYFTLKDRTAQIAAVMFRGQARQAKFVPEDGMSVIGLGRLTVYESRGSYQIIIEYVEPAGVGALQVAFETLKRKLYDLGLFDQRHKKPLPFLPRAVSLITSPSGAVVHDLITVITRRSPGVHLRVIPVRVQGAGAEDDIVRALRLANERNDSDLVILARGGGSLEDLQAFNSEAVAWAIHRSLIPVVSAVGHETDVTIADFVADLRAATPSAAGELAVPDVSELVRRCLAIRLALHNRFLERLQKVRNQFKDLNRRLCDPRKKIQEHWIRVDDNTARLTRLIHLCLRHEREQVVGLNRRLLAASPRMLVRQHRSKHEACEQRLMTGMSTLVKNKRAGTRESTLRLGALNPLAILKRGYSVTRTLPMHRVVTRPDQVEVGTEVETLVAEGRLLCSIKGKSSHGQENV
jgi:exodeoxyribonuclease VII large subunit